MLDLNHSFAKAKARRCGFVTRTCCWRWMRRRRARALKDTEAAAAFGVAVRSIESLRQRFVVEGLDAALDRKQQVRPSVRRMFDGEKEAHLIAVACGAAPDGRARWTLELLSERVVALKIVDHCSPQTIMRTLKKTN